MKKVRAYLSHYIRGSKGSRATLWDINGNCRRAEEVAATLRRLFPNLRLYVPAESEPFVGKCYRNRYLDEKKILYIDCLILKECGTLIYFSPDRYFSRGMQIELDYAREHKIPVANYFDLIKAQKLPASFYRRKQ
jgi:hypothetical protein